MAWKTALSLGSASNSQALDIEGSDVHVLVVDDDQRLRDLVKQYLQQHRPWCVTTASDVDHGKAMLQLLTFDALVVDIMMPGQPGTDLLSVLHRPPVLLLTAMGAPHERIQGLTQGAEDYLAKPFEPEELALRLDRWVGQRPRLVCMGQLTYCLRSQILRDPEGVVLLSPREKQVLHILASCPGMFFDRKELNHNPDQESVSDRTVDTIVTRLRKKIEPMPEQPQYIVSSRGQGYCLYPD